MRDSDVVDQERDLGVIVDKFLKLSRQCDKAAVNGVSGMINRTFLCKDKDLSLQHNRSLVRPRLLYSGLEALS